MRVTVIPFVVGTLGTIPKKTTGIVNLWKNREYPDHSHLKID